MYRDELKHYTRYVNSLHKFAYMLGIKIVYEGDEDGVYVPSRNLIRISPDLSQTEEVASLIHELGHVIDFLFMPRNINTELAYSKIYKYKVSKNEIKLVVKSEKLAWNLGRIIARILGIPLGKWYTLQEKESIKGYKKS